MRTYATLSATELKLLVATLEAIDIHCNSVKSATLAKKLRKAIGKYDGPLELAGPDDDELNDAD